MLRFGGDRGRKKGGFINHQDASLLQRRVPSKPSPSLSQILFSNEKILNRIVIPRKVPFKHSPSLSQILSPNEKILNRILMPRRVPSKHSP
jgi:hypothetical protein